MCCDGNELSSRYCRRVSTCGGNVDSDGNTTEER